MSQMSQRPFGLKRLALVWTVALLELILGFLLAIWLLSLPLFFRFYYPLLQPAGNTDANQVVEWLAGNDPVEMLNPSLRQGHFVQKELTHYDEVRVWLRRSQWTLTALLAFSIAFLGWAKPSKDKLIAAQWRTVAAVALFSAGALLLAWWDWKIFFKWIHYPFFGATSWKLPKASYSLKLFPAHFWQTLGAGAVLLPLMLALGLRALMAIPRGPRKEKESRSFPVKTI